MIWKAKKIRITFEVQPRCLIPNTLTTFPIFDDTYFDETYCMLIAAYNTYSLII